MKNPEESDFAGAATPSLSTVTSTSAIGSLSLGSACFTIIAPLSHIGFRWNKYQRGSATRIAAAPPNNAIHNALFVTLVTWTSLCNIHILRRLIDGLNRHSRTI